MVRDMMTQWLPLLGGELCRRGFRVNRSNFFWDEDGELSPVEVGVGQ